MKSPNIEKTTAVWNWNTSPRILAGTGHRPHKLNFEYDLQGPCSNFLRTKILECFSFLNPKKIISGMALGFDQLFALVAIEQNLPVIAAIPCDNQESIWPAQSQALYRSILKSDLVVSKIVSPGPYQINKLQIRNEWMVNNSDALLAIWDESSGGTANCIRYAKSVDKLVYRVDPRDFLNLRS